MSPLTKFPLGNGVQIGGALNLGGSKLYGNAMLGGMRVDGALVLGGSPPAKWMGHEQYFDLRGAAVKGLDDDPDAWPQTIYMAGFTIEGTRSQGYSQNSEFIDRDATWYLGWLNMDPGSPRTAYIQLENNLKAAGRFDEASSIGMARVAKEYASEGGVRLLLSPIHRFTVGYGYHPEYIVPWALALIAIGSLVARRLPWYVMRDVGATSKIVLSAHRLIPLISFGKAYADIDLSSPKVKPWIRRYFYLHSILGYILAAILVTALAGVSSVPTFK